MGNCFSAKLTCPKNYDYDKFSKIRKLFHFLDGNGDRVITGKEMGQFTNIYYDYDLEDKKRTIKESVVKEQDEINELLEQKKFNLDKYRQKCYVDNKVKTLNKRQKEIYSKEQLKYKNKINNVYYEYNCKRARLETYVNLIESFNRLEKSKQLVEEIGKKRFYEIEFNHFFNFIKDRDIDYLFRQIFD